MLTVDLDRLGIEPGSRVLDLGAGAGRHSYAAQRCGAHVVAADLDDVVLKDVRPMMDAVALEENVPAGACTVADALRLPFRDGAFDHVIVSEVLEHIPADADAMREVARVVRPGGTIAVTVPRFWPEAVCWALSSEYHSNPGGHVRIYRRSQLLERLSGAGLVPYGAHHAHAFHVPYWWLRCAGDLQGERFPARHYHRFLVWDIERPNRWVRGLERVLDPLAGKSYVAYLHKGPSRVAL